MWPFSNKKTLVQQGVFQDFTDNHSHILPGVDDGVETMTEALKILEKYEALGVRKVWLTPHVQEYMPNTTEELQRRYDKLIGEYKGNVELHLAAEYMLDNIFMERLEKKDFLYHSLPGDATPLLLVETSYFNPPMDFWGTIDKIMRSGIRPILAHPERYLYMTDDDYKRLHDMGIILQMNIPSLMGHYGKEPKRRAEKLLSKGYYTVYGTDIHSIRMIEGFQKIKVSPVSL